MRIFNTLWYFFQAIESLIWFYSISRWSRLDFSAWCGVRGHLLQKCSVHQTPTHWHENNAKMTVNKQEKWNESKWGSKNFSKEKTKIGKKGHHSGKEKKLCSCQIRDYYLVEFSCSTNNQRHTKKIYEAQNSFRTFKCKQVRVRCT